eukprot:7335166-Prymnesium_polylepis.1
MRPSRSASPTTSSSDAVPSPRSAARNDDSMSCANVCIGWQTESTFDLGRWWGAQPEAQPGHGGRVACSGKS